MPQRTLIKKPIFSKKHLYNILQKIDFCTGSRMLCFECEPFSVLRSSKRYIISYKDIYLQWVMIRNISASDHSIENMYNKFSLRKCIVFVLFGLGKVILHILSCTSLSTIVNFGYKTASSLFWSEFFLLGIQSKDLICR